MFRQPIDSLRIYSPRSDVVSTSVASRLETARSASVDAPPRIDDTRISEITELAPPAHLLREFPSTARPAATTYEARHAIHRVLHGADDRLVVVVGPCSIHDYDAAIDYATHLAAVKRELADRLLVVMRVYFEKPRTTVGWKGLINDPRLDDSFRINEGLRLARRILLEVNELELPAGTEYLDMITPQYIADLIAWGAIGARTTESQVHRQLASGLSCPVGFKNGTNGDVRIAVDAVKAASAPHHFLSVTKGGHSAIVHTAGNEDCHVILRGGKAPNYDATSVDAASKELASNGLAARVMVDCSHANSSKQHERQVVVARDVAAQVAAGDARICGVMIESHLNAGRQDLVAGQPLQYGVSITDACIGWDATVDVLRELADAVGQRRVKLAEEA
ncbi:MAG: 3-deoxy-7-phosphoheptulonate synthase AroG [Burkholderiales bacterium]|nr:3-deoxy-7-phosphoheptulonate synthase AroG [Burkholderiales bacterium]